MTLLEIDNKVSQWNYSVRLKSTRVKLLGQQRKYHGETLRCHGGTLESIMVKP